MRLNTKTFRPLMDLDLRKALNFLYRYPAASPDIIIQTGADYEMVMTVMCAFAERVKQMVYLPPYHVIEPSYSPFIKFSTLFKGTKNIVPHFSLPVALDKATQFMAQDVALQSPDAFPEIAYDAENPIDFYTMEAEGRLFGETHVPSDNAVEKIAQSHHIKHPLFILRGVGGLGLMELQKIEEMFSHINFLVLLFELEHIKHFRSLQRIQSEPHYTIYSMRERQWVLACRYFETKGKASWPKPVILPYDEKLET